MRAKFLSSTNKGMDYSMPKGVYADITFGKIIWWYLNDVECFRTSKIERFTWDKNTKHLTVFTLNSIYEFELETDEFYAKHIQFITYPVSKDKITIIAMIGLPIMLDIKFGK